MNGKNCIALVLQLGTNVRCDLSEVRLNKAKTGMVRVLSNWEVKFDPSKGPTVDDVKRFAGDSVVGKEVVTLNAYDSAMSSDGGFRVLFAILDGEAPKAVAKK